jgi:hypothetical protein
LTVVPLCIAADSFGVSGDGIDLVGDVLVAAKVLLRRGE